MIQALKEAIILTASYYGRTLSEPVLNMYIEDLQDLPTDQVIKAYREWRRNPRQTAFPLPGQIRGMVSPQVDPQHAAQEIAARITGAIAKFGWCNAREAEAFIGPVGWGIVQRQGGWSYICENHGLTIQPSAFQAQVRDQAAAELKYPSGAIARSLGITERARGGELQSIGELLRLPEGKGE